MPPRHPLCYEIFKVKEQSSCYRDCEPFSFIMWLDIFQDNWFKWDCAGGPRILYNRCPGETFPYCSIINRLYCLLLAVALWKAKKFVVSVLGLEEKPFFIFVIFFPLTFICLCEKETLVIVSLEIQ